MKSHRIPFFLLTLSLAASLCASPLQAGEEPAPAPQAAATAEVQSDAFALQAFQHLLKAQKGNVVFSPAGLEGALRLLQQGARGKVAEELAALPMGKGEGGSAMQVCEANALFVAEDLKLKPGVKVDAVIRAPFATDLEKSKTLINEWADKNTRGMIPKLDVDIDEETRLVAATAIALEEKWLAPFLPHKNSERNFHLSDGSTKKVCMMSKNGYFSYAEDEDWAAVALFYKTDGRPGTPGCFIGILPKGDARAFAAGLTPEKMSAIRGQLDASKNQMVEVNLPKFETSTPTYSLKSVLQACGVHTAFLPGADFSGFADEDLVLEEVRQKCFVKVDEEGTKAAAVTGFGYGLGAPGPRPEPKVITFDRPFLWVIGDLTTPAAPWFMGLCEEP